MKFITLHLHRTHSTLPPVEVSVQARAVVSIERSTSPGADESIVFVTSGQKLHVIETPDQIRALVEASDS